jgi:hypothetical protein
MKPESLKNQGKSIAVAIAAVALCAGATAQAQILIDAFNGESLSAYTETPVLYSGTAPSTTVITFSDSSGYGLGVSSTTYNNIEQALFLTPTGLFGVGDTLEVGVNMTSLNNEDFGLAVATTATPTAASPAVGGNANTRTTLSYGFISVRDSTSHLIVNGWDGATAMTTAQNQPGSGTVTTLFITETAANTFQFGYFSTSQGGGTTPEILETYNFANATAASEIVGSAVGFYSDMRENNATIGYYDDLTVIDSTTPVLIPEPATLALCGMGLAGLIARKWRK